MVKKLLFALLKLSLIALALYFISQKIDWQDFKNIEWSWSLRSFWALFIFLSLWLLNILLDAVAWQKVQSILQAIPLKLAVLHNLKCYGLSFISPVNSGEVIGRYIIQDQAENRSKSLYLTFWTHAPKLFSKALLSFLIIPFLFPDLSAIYRLALLVLFFLGLLLYLRLEKFLSWLAKKRWGRREFKNYIVTGKPLLPQKLILLGLNGIRFLIYSAQLGLVLWGLQLSDFSFTILLSIPVYYFISALIPSYTGLDFLIKGALSLYYFELFTPNNLGFALASTFVWAFNWAIPATLGLISLKGQELARLKRKKA